MLKGAPPKCSNTFDSANHDDHVRITMANRMKPENAYARKCMTPDRLRELLRYDPHSGAITWAVNRGPMRAGYSAGCRKPDGYIEIRIEGAIYGAHVIAWTLHTGAWPAHEIDHRDLDNSNNIFSNLREATRVQNNANQGLSVKNTSGFKGVSGDKKEKKWIARINTSCGRIRLGSFDAPEDGYRAYQKASRLIHGEFARV